MFRVLVVDDDEVSCNAIDRSLSGRDVHVQVLADAESAGDAISLWNPHLIILEIDLPTVDGLNVLVHIRRFTDARVMVLSHRCEEADRLLGFEIGADDYVGKPCSSREISARVRSIVRRQTSRPTETQAEAANRIHAGTLVLDRSSREVLVGETIVALTAKEFELLFFLAAAPRRVYTREQLLESVWKSSSGWQDPGTVTEHVRRLRRNLELAGGSRNWIRTVRGNGYAFEVSPRPSLEPATAPALIDLR